LEAVTENTNEPLFTRAQYCRMNDRQLEIEHWMDLLKLAGHDESEERMKKLWSEWEQLQYLGDV
jgi:hypothetical protein